MSCSRKARMLHAPAHLLRVRVRARARVRVGARARARARLRIRVWVRARVRAWKQRPEQQPSAATLGKREMGSWWNRSRESTYDSSPRVRCGYQRITSPLRIARQRPR